MMGKKKPPPKLVGAEVYMQELTEGLSKEIFPSETTLVSSQKVFRVKQPPHGGGGQTLDKPVCKFITRLQTLENAARPYGA